MRDVFTFFFDNLGLQEFYFDAKVTISIVIMLVKNGKYVILMIIICFVFLSVVVPIYLFLFATLNNSEINTIFASENHKHKNIEIITVCPFLRGLFLK